MENYISIHINNIETFIDINYRIDNIKKILDKNKNATFELNYENNNDNKNVNFKNAHFYIKKNLKEEIDLNCYICYNKKMPYHFIILQCNHRLCKDCFNKWNITCPFCRTNIT